MSCPFPAQACAHKCITRARALTRDHADTHTHATVTHKTSTLPCRAAPPSLASVTKFHFTKLSRPRSTHPFLLSHSFIFHCFLWDVRLLCRQVTRNNVCNAEARFAWFWLAYSQEKVGSWAHYVQHPFSEFQIRVYTSLPQTSLPLCQYTPVTHGALYALRTELNTAEQAQYRTTTSTSPLSVWRIQPSPPTCTSCKVFVTHSSAFRLRLFADTHLWRHYVQFKYSFANCKFSTHTDTRRLLWFSTITLLSGGTMAFKISWTCELSLAVPFNKLSPTVQPGGRVLLHFTHLLRVT